MSTTGHFDETDFESFYRGGLTFEGAKELLQKEDQGVFLLRDSSRGGYVLCVKEEKDVEQYQIVEMERKKGYYIREDCPFKDLPSLLSFYKRNLFKSTPLIRPIINLDMRRSTVVGGLGDGLKVPNHKQDPQVRNSTPVLPHSSNEKSSPMYAKVIKGRTPIAYETSALHLRVGEIILVTRMKDGQGQGELMSTNKKGNFPLTHVELMSSTDLLTDLPHSHN